MSVLYRMACFLGYRLPPFLCRWLARRIAEFRYLCFPRLRRVLTENYRKVLVYRQQTAGVAWTRAELRALVVDGFYSFGRYLADFFGAARWTPRMVRKLVSVEGLSVLDEGLREGRGMVVLTAHLGNWELGGMVTSLLGYPVTAIALPFGTRTVREVFRVRRQQKGVETVLMGENLRQVLRAVRRNRILAVLGDRLFTERGMEVNFLGEKVLLPRGPAALAVRTGARMAAGFLIADKARYRLFFEPIPRPPAGADDRAAEEFLVKEGARIMERQILAHPSQWLNFSPMRAAPDPSGQSDG